MTNLTKMLCLVDGEHYLPVTQEAIDTLNNLEHIDITAVVFIGGTEKLRDDSEESYSKVLGVPVQFAKGTFSISQMVLIRANIMISHPCT